MKSFRLEKVWLSYCGFKDFVYLLWSNCHVEGDVAFRMFSKLKFLKKEIRKWTKENFYIIKVMKLKLLDPLRNYRRDEVVVWL